jgi:hypothetical protein
MKWTSAGSFAYLWFPVTPLVVVRAVHVLRSGNKGGGVRGGFERAETLWRDCQKP